MPRHAPELECSVDDKASLVALARSRTAEAHAVERARIILACLDGKEIQQVARELGVSVATVSKWRQRFSLWGLRGQRDQPRPGKPVRHDNSVSQTGTGHAGGTTAARHVPLGRTGGGGETRRHRSRSLACLAPRRHLPSKAA